MDLTNQVKKICQVYDIWPERSKGQNFLINSEIIDQIIEAADLKKSDTILEVGPGLGILTEALVKQSNRVIAIELDNKIYNFLKTKFSGFNNLELINDDILKIGPTSYLLSRCEIGIPTKTSGLPTSYKIVANLPYNITSHFLKNFLTAQNRPSEMILLVQKEVAQRICTKPGQMSLLSVSVQFHGQPEIVGLVNKNNFWPRPQVDSAVIKISNIKKSNEVDNYLQPYLISESEFWRCVKIGFSARRKQLKNNLTAGYKISSEIANKLLNEAKLDDKIRPQNLSVAQWLALAGQIKSELT